MARKKAAIMDNLAAATTAEEAKQVAPNNNKSSTKQQQKTVMAPHAKRDVPVVDPESQVRYSSYLPFDFRWIRRLNLEKID